MDLHCTRKKSIFKASDTTELSSLSCGSCGSLKRELYFKENYLCSLQLTHSRTHTHTDMIHRKWWRREREGAGGCDEGLSRSDSLSDTRINVMVRTAPQPSPSPWGGRLLRHIAPGADGSPEVRGDPALTPLNTAPACRLGEGGRDSTVVTGRTR